MDSDGLAVSLRRLLRRSVSPSAGSRTELHDAFASLACSLICWGRLKKTHT